MAKIIEYSKEYGQAVRSLIVSIFVDEYGFENYRESCANAKYEKYKDTNGNCWIALDSYGEVIGSIALIGLGEAEANLEIMYVHNEYRGQGVAQDLYNALYNFAIENGIRKIILGTYERLGRAINFYKKNGFVEYEHNNYTYDDKYFYLDVV